MLLNNSLVVNKLAVGVSQSMSTFRLLPPDANLVLLTFVVYDLMLHTILLYAMSFCLSSGISSLSIKNHVSAPMFCPSMS